MNNLNFRSVTFNLIAINVLVYLTCKIYPQLNLYLSMHYFFNTHGYISDIMADKIDLANYPMVDAYLSQHGHDPVSFMPLQIISHMFMHDPTSWMHIIFNMWGLFLFGSVLEQVWGAKRFLFFYLITGFGAVLLYEVVQFGTVYYYTNSVNPTLAMLNQHPEAMSTYFSSVLGASGAIFGISTAFAMLFPNTELMIIPIPIPIKAKYLMPIYILVEFFLGVSRFSGDDVAHFAHLGGALFGFILVKLWNRNRNSLY